MKTATRILFASVFILLFTITIPAAAQKKTAVQPAIKNAVDSQRYTFFAQYAIPARFNQRYLTPEYTFSISKDTVNSYLPYFGQAYSAAFNTDGGIKFIATNFDYTVSNNKRGGWDVAIKPKNVQDVRLVTLRIFENGRATLQVNSNNRDPISYNGYIEASTNQ